MIQDSKPSLDNNIITHPAHYIEGRVFEPITIIEEFGLCHHLACVVKYIARAGRKTSLLNDLLKSQWYLDREISRHQAGVELCSAPLKRTPELKVSAICEDWKLSPHLTEVLSCILNYRLDLGQQQKFQWVRKNFQSSDSGELLDGAFHLITAREHLRMEIDAHTPKKAALSDQGGSR